jgi:hypothetical protein
VEAQPCCHILEFRLYPEPDFSGSVLNGLFSVPLQKGIIMGWGVPAALSGQQHHRIICYSFKSLGFLSQTVYQGFKDHAANLVSYPQEMFYRRLTHIVVIRVGSCGGYH